MKGSGHGWLLLIWFFGALVSLVFTGVMIWGIIELVTWVTAK